jgi:hypothetical protein
MLDGQKESHSIVLLIVDADLFKINKLKIPSCSPYVTFFEDNKTDPDMVFCVAVAGVSVNIYLLPTDKRKGGKVTGNICYLSCCSFGRGSKGAGRGCTLCIEQKYSG